MLPQVIAPAFIRMLPQTIRMHERWSTTAGRGSNGTAAAPSAQPPIPSPYPGSSVVPEWVCT